MRLLGRVLLTVLVVLAVARLVSFGIYGGLKLTSDLEAYHLESKFVHLAWRFQSGLALYPEWRKGPHVSNFFSPVYFVVVGLIGRFWGSSLDGLASIGRAVSFGSNLGIVAVLAWVVKGRWGVGAGLFAASVGIGTAYEYGFAVMARPDLLAELLGVLGFVLAVGRGRWGQGAGVCLLVLAALTKQTTVAYLLAAGLAWGLSGEWRRGGMVLVAGLGVIGGLVALGAVFWEPRLAADLLGERVMPFDLAGWGGLWLRALTYGPEVVLLTVFGGWYWSRRASRDGAWLALVLVLVPVTVATTAKRGADLNYLLGWRAIAMMGAGVLWGVLRSADRFERRAGYLVATGCVVAMAHSAFHGYQQAVMMQRTSAFLAAPAGRMLERVWRVAEREAADPAVRLLTDDGRIDIRQGARTQFGDPWLFRQLVNLGEIEPVELERAIEAREFDRIMTRSELMADAYAGYEFGLPMVLVEPIRRRYRLAGVAGQMFVYEPSEEAAR